MYSSPNTIKVKNGKNAVCNEYSTRGRKYTVLVGKLDEKRSIGEIKAWIEELH